MQTKQWSSEIRMYKLNESFDLERAKHNEFSKYYAIYHTDINFKVNFEQKCSVVAAEEPYFWIRKDGKRIGGVYIVPNQMERFFLIPPFDDTYTVVGLLKKALIQISDKSKDIRADVITQPELECYLRVGFRLDGLGRWMIRPTETFDIQWDEKFIIARPKKEETEKIGELFFEAFKNDVGKTKYSLIERISFVNYYFEHNSHIELLNKASTVIYDKTTNELIGICLISEFKAWPLVYDIAVKPGYTGNGLAQRMLKHALSVLNDNYPAVRLYVQGGNDAETTYYNMGFLPGIMLASLSIPAETLSDTP